MKIRLARPGLADFFLILFVGLAAASVYFTFVRPVKFSGKILREGVTRYGEVEILLPEELYWLKGEIPVGEEYRNVYGALEWKVLEWGDETLAGRTYARLRVKLLIVREDSGILRYGKYTLVTGGRIFLINDRYFIEGRVYRYRELDEKMAL